MLSNPLTDEEKRQEWLDSLIDGEPCDHPGCLSHVSHPCEGCGRIAGRRIQKCLDCGASIDSPLAAWQFYDPIKQELIKPLCKNCWKKRDSEF